MSKWLNGRRFYGIIRQKICVLSDKRGRYFLSMLNDSI